MAEVEYQGLFNITVRQVAGRWIATIRKIDGTMLRVDLPGKHEPCPSLDTDPPTYSASSAIQLAKDAIEGGKIK
jgi:hypothetical protein